MFDNFMTAETLTTFAGITGAVIVIVQFTKSLIKKRFGDQFVRLYSFIIAFILSLIFISKEGISLESIILTIPMAQSIRKNK